MDKTTTAQEKNKNLAKESEKRFRALVTQQVTQPTNTNTPTHPPPQNHAQTTQKKKEAPPTLPKKNAWERPVYK